MIRVGVVAAGMALRIGLREVLNGLPEVTVVAEAAHPDELPRHETDVLVLTSIQEGSPTVVKEALACNLPVVSLDVGDVRQRLEGIAGCEVCGDEQAQTIATSLERVLRIRERINGREAIADLDERLLTQKLIRIYKSVLSRNAYRETVGPDHMVQPG